MPEPDATNRQTQWKRITYTVFAPIYDLVVWPLQRARKASIRLLDPRPGERVLIVGAGTGQDLRYLPAGLHMTAIDITPVMLSKLRRRAERLGLGVDPRVMDGHALEFPDASFDAVILHLILAVIANPVRCIQEVARVLRPGGRAIIMDKFVPDDAAVPLILRLLDPVSNCLATRVTRKLGPILAGSGLEIVREEPGWFRGYYRIALVRKR
ncbi:MAG: methyltransferase domain-containing protein [Planctomycetes bacterium]|nr:methyltransferase domain-containing protein [Planctomycetota bacterium]